MSECNLDRSSIFYNSPFCFDVILDDLKLVRRVSVQSVPPLQRGAYLLPCQHHTYIYIYIP